MHRKASLTLSNTQRTLTQLEKLGATATGILYVGQIRPCAILLQQGRIYWAGAAGGQAQLTSLLLEESSAHWTRRALAELYRQCRSSGTPLLQTLVSRGVVTPEGLRRSLLRHTCRSIALACSASDLQLRWHAQNWAERACPGTDSPYSLAPSELLHEVVRHQLPVEARTARALLAELVPSGGSGLAYHLQQPTGLPLAFRYPGTPQVEALSRAATWADNMLTLARGLDSRSTDLIVRGQHDSESKVLICCEGDLVLMLRCPDASDLGLLVTKRARAREACQQRSATATKPLANPLRARQYAAAQLTSLAAHINRGYGAASGTRWQPMNDLISAQRDLTRWATA